MVQAADGPPARFASAVPLFGAPDGWTLFRLTDDGLFKHRPVVSPDGRSLLFSRHKDERISMIVRDLESRVERRLTSRDEPEFDAAWSPDGKHALFSHVSFSGTQGDVDVYLIDADGRNLRSIAATEGGLSHEEWPSWSPDGSRIAFTSTRSGNQEVYVALADGSGAAAVTQHVGTDAHPAWTHDGASIVFATDRWGGLEVAIMKADGSEVRRLTHSPGLDDYPACSPDGRWVAFVSNRDGNLEVYRMNADGGSPVNLSQGDGLDTFPSWTSDGKGIVWLSDRGGRIDVLLLDESPSRDGQ
jgi:TolB protein